MLNTFHKVFKFIFLFSAVISGWTSILLLSNSTLNMEIKDVINEMYINQKKFALNVKELSLLLVKDANKRFYDNDITHLK